MLQILEKLTCLTATRWNVFPVFKGETKAVSQFRAASFGGHGLRTCGLQTCKIRRPGLRGTSCLRQQPYIMKRANCPHPQLVRKRFVTASHPDLRGTLQHQAETHKCWLYLRWTDDVAWRSCQSEKGFPPQWDETAQHSRYFSLATNRL